MDAHHQNITERAVAALADEFHYSQSDSELFGVGGGYSRNRRSIVRMGDEWVFAKEVDTTLLSDEGEEELRWLQKDHEVTRYLNERHVAVAPGWSRLVADGHVLVLPAYRAEDGWLWQVPDDVASQTRYINAVVRAVSELEQLQPDADTIERLNLQPFFRDELAFDQGFSLLLGNTVVREQVKTKMASLAAGNVAPHLKPMVTVMIELLDDRQQLEVIAQAAAQLAEQPNNCFGHCDVRSDNLAYHPETDVVKLVDWNWASLTPRGFGATEFLMDMARRGADITPWVTELNPQLLAACVGCYAIKCIKDPFAPGNTLRDMQAETTAVAYILYRKMVIA